jgi:hypothetical protein
MSLATRSPSLSRSVFEEPTLSPPRRTSKRVRASDELSATAAAPGVTWKETSVVAACAAGATAAVASVAAAAVETRRRRFTQRIRSGA